MMNKKLLLLCALLSLWGSNLFAQRIPMAATAEDSARWEEIKREKLPEISTGLTPQAAPVTFGGGLITPLSQEWPSAHPNSIHVNRSVYPEREYKPEDLVAKVLLNTGNMELCQTTGIVSNVRFTGSILTSHTTSSHGSGYGWDESTKQWSPGYDRGLSYFSHGENNLDGMQSGLLLSTAGGLGAEGPNSTTGSYYEPFKKGPLDGWNENIRPKAPNQNNIDLQLRSLVSATDSVYGSSVLEFDFVALSNEISFEYIFASEEYPEYVGSTYNDVFGFFIRPTSTPTYTNIATLPTTETGNYTVSINNVNWGNNVSNPTQPCLPSLIYPNSRNPEYFVPNYYCETGGGSNYMEYDGRTKLLKAKHPVVIGNTYHMKFVIGNIGDDRMGSGVFLKAGSFDIGMGLRNKGAGNENMDNIFEGCEENELTLALYTTINRDITLSYTGDGAQYLTSESGGAMPGTTTYPANALSHGIKYKVKPNLPENINGKYVDITATIAACNATFTKRLYLFKSFTNPVLDIKPACGGNKGEIAVSVTGGTGKPQMQLNGSGEWKRKHTGLIAGQYTVKIRDSIGCQVETRTVTVPDYPAITSGANSQSYCPGVTITPPPFVTNIAGATISWNINDPVPLGLSVSSGTGNLPQLTTSNAEASPKTINITGSVSAGECSANYSFTITVYGKLSAGEINADQNICYNIKPATINNTTAASGGDERIYSWEQSTDGSNWTSAPGSSNSSTYIFSNGLTQTTWYRRKVTSSCGAETTVPVKITVGQELKAGTIGSNQSICYDTKPNDLSNTTIASGDVPLTYSWEQSTDGLTWGAAIRTSNSPTYTFLSEDKLTTTTMYRRKVSNSCGSKYSDTITVTVYQQLTAGTSSAPKTQICYNDTPGQITGGIPSGGTGTYTYQWQQSTDGSSWNPIPLGSGGTLENFSPPALTQTRYYKRRVTSAPCGTVEGNIVTIQVYPQLNAGTISAPADICYNANTVISSTAAASGGNTNDGYAYQWQKYNGSAWENIDDEYGLSYTTPNLTQTTSYRRTVENTCGDKTTNEITINVYDALQAGTISSPQTICAGTAPTALNGGTATGGDGSYTYLWEQSIISAGSGWVNASGSNTYENYNPPALNQTTWYRRQVTSACGTVTSAAVQITVKPRVVANDITAANKTICAGEPANLTASAAGIPGATFKWYTIGGDPLYSGANYTPSPGATTTYYVGAEGTNHCENLSSNRKEVTVTVKPRATAANINANDVTVCPGEEVTLSVSAVGVDNPQFKWFNAVGNVQYNTVSTYTITPTGTIAYYVTVEGTNYCANALSDRRVITVTVKPRATAADISVTGETTICYNSGTSLTASAAGITGATFKWYASQNADSPLGTDPSYSTGNLTSTTKYYVSVSGTGICENDKGARMEVTVNVIPQMSITAKEPAAICSGNSFEVSPSNGGGDLVPAGTIYTWTVEPNANISGATAQPVAQTKISQTLTNSSAVQQTVRYNVTPQIIDNGKTCNGPLFTIDVKVNPGANMKLSSALSLSPICSDGTVNYTATSATGGVSFSWTRASVSGISPATGSGTGTTINEILSNSTTTTQEVAYVFTLTTADGACSNSGAETTVKVQVYGALMGGSVNGDQTVCKGVTPAELTNVLLPEGGNGTYSYQWESSANGSDWTNVLSNGISENYSPPALNQTTWYRRKASSGIGGSCGSEYSNSIKITVDNQAVAADIAVSGITTICHNTGTTLTASSSTIPDAVFEWFDAAGNSLGTDASYTTGNLTSSTNYSVSVSGTGYCANKSSERKAVTVTVNQYAVAADITASDKTICLGATANLTASSSTVPDAEFEWYDSGENPLGSGATYSPSPSVTTTYYVGVLGTGYCENKASDRKAVTVTVNQYATAADIMTGDITICHSTGTTLTANLSESSSISDATFKWYDDSGMALDEGASYPTGDLTSTTVYYVSVRGTNHCENKADDRKKVTVTVNQYAAAADIEVSDKTICHNTGTTLTASLTAVSSISGAVFKWYDDSSTPLGEGASYPTGNLTSTTTYYVSVSGTNRCENKATDRKAVTVTVNQYAVAADITASDETICLGATATLTASSSTVPDAEFAWYDSDETPLGSGATYSPSPSVTTTYYVGVLGTGYCENQASDRKAVTVTVNQYAVAADITASDETICYGSTANLTASSSTIPDAEFKWYDAAGIPLGSGATYSPSPSVTTTYYVGVSGTNHCENKEDDRKAVKVIVNQYAAENNIDVSGTTICHNASTILTASSSTIPDAIFEWFDADAHYLSTGASYPTGNLTSTTIYYVSVSGTGYCANEVSDRKEVTVTVNQYAVAADITASDETICLGATATLTASSSTVPDAEFKWYDADETPLGSGATYSPSPSVTTTYYVGVLGTGYCENQASDRKAVTVTVNQYATAADITASDETICYGSTANLTASSSTIPDAEFKWYDAAGIPLGSGATYSPSPSITTTYYVGVSGTNHCENKEDDRKEVTVTVISEIVIASVQTTTICSGAEFSVIPADGGGNIVPAGTLYTWTVEENANVEGEADQTLPQSSIHQTLTTGSPIPQTVKYTVTPQLTVNGVECLSAATFEVEVTVNPGSTMILDSDLETSVCSGGNVGYTASSATPNVSFSWTRAAVPGITGEGSGVGNTINDVLTNPSTETKEVVYVFTLSTADGCSNSNEQTTVTVKVYGLASAGSIDNNGSQTICGGSTPNKLESLTEPVGGNGVFSYQWQSSTDEGASWTDIGGATYDDYMPPALSETTWYRRKEIGICETVYTNIVIITVSAQQVTAGTIVTNGGDFQQICYNTVPVHALENLSLPSGGDGIFSYQWQSSITNNGIDWADIAGATGTDYIPTAPLTETTWFVRKETGSCGTSYSNTLTIIVYGRMDGGTFVTGGLSTDTAVCYGDTPVLAPSVASGGVNRTWQWEQSSNGIDWAIADGDAGAEFYIAPALTQTTLFRRMVISESGCGFAYSDTLTVTVYDLLTGGTITSAGIAGVCVNTSPATLTATAPTGGSGEYFFQWQQCENGVTWNDIVDATDESYNPPALTVETWYRRKVISKICEALSDTVKIEIYPSLSSGTMESLDQIICYNTSPGTLSVSIPVGGSGTYSYQWQHSGNSGALWTDIAGANGATYTPPALQSNSWYRRIVSGGCLAISDTVKIDILEASILRFPDIRLSTCPNNSAPIDLSKYLDIMDSDPRIAGINWDKRGAAPPITSDGVIAANAFVGGGFHYTYTYTITTTGGCASDIPQKVYLRVIKNSFKMKTDTIAVCYETAEKLHINQILGLETGGTFNYPLAIAQYLTPNSAGSLILDGKSAYEHVGLLDTITYRGTTAKYVEFEYVTGSDSCLNGKTYKIIVVLTPTL